MPLGLTPRKRQCDESRYEQHSKKLAGKGVADFAGNSQLICYSLFTKFLPKQQGIRIDAAKDVEELMDIKQFASSQEICRPTSELRELPNRAYGAKRGILLRPAAHSWLTVC